MIDPISQSDNYAAARMLLDASVLRQQAISANIANAETPGYHRIDLSPDFQAELKSALKTGGIAQNIADLRPRLAEDTHARSTKPDGNSVELETELVAMNRNSVDYDFLTEVVSRHIKQLKMAISGRTG